MQQRAPRVFQWFNLCLFVIVLLLLSVQGIAFALFPASAMQRFVGRGLVTLCVIQFVILIRWLLKRRGRDASEAK